MRRGSPNREQMRRYRPPLHPQCDVSSDESRFVMIQVQGEGVVGSELLLVQNFFEELKKLVGN